MKKSIPMISALSLCVLFNPHPASAEEALLLPRTLDEWQMETEDLLILRTASDDMGSLRSRNYVRHEPRAHVEVILMEGPGPGTLWLPSRKVRETDAPIGFGSTYETLRICEHEAILEYGETLGYALAIKLGDDRTLTLESRGISREELMNFAKRMTERMPR
ncbi:MAG: hypothetical protein GX256_01550 [Fretibacterium sp.]|nr:hypothetical protein [Fretibacterium sp.]